MTTERKLPQAKSVESIEEHGDKPDFVCEDCGDSVFVFGDHDGFPVCATCRFIRAHPDMPENIKATLRGDE